VTLALHKPAGVVVTASDERGRPTVYEVLRRSGVPLTPGLRYVGRLDQDTAGLLLLTTDGVLAHRLTHPRYGVRKVYEAALDHLPPPRALEQLRRGIELSDGITAPAELEVQRREPPVVRLTIHEGRNRQVRRMFEATGVRVRQLLRTHVGPIALGRLRPGESRPLTRSEVRGLRELVGLEAGGGDERPTDVVKTRARPLSSTARPARTPAPNAPGSRAPRPRPSSAAKPPSTGGPDRRRR
jgi:pseudouridine synthase